MNNQKKAYIFALLSVLLWSTVATAFKITLKSMDYSLLIFYSSGFSLLIIFLIVVIQKKLSKFKELKSKDIIWSALLGLLNPFLYYLILFKAYSLLPAQMALSLNYTWAIIVVLLSIPLLKQKISFSSIIAIFISFIGVNFIATQGDITGLKFTNTFGVVLAISSSFFWALYWLLNTKDSVDPTIRLLLNFIFGFSYSIISVIFIFEFKFPDVNGILGSAYIGFFEMGVTFVLWLNALKLSETTAKVSNLIYLSPFLSLFFISFIIGEEILFSTIIGLIFIIFGIILQNKSKLKFK